jgi:hypothetical protein
LGEDRLFSTKPICIEFYPRTSPITIAGDRTVRWAKPRHAAKQGPSLGKHAQRSPPNLCSVGYTTFTALLHDKFLRPTAAELCISPDTWDRMVDRKELPPAVVVSGMPRWKRLRRG